MRTSLCLSACVTLLVILLEETPTDGLLCTPMLRAPHLRAPPLPSVLVGMHTGVKHSWHHKAGGTRASRTQEVPEHLLCQPRFLMLSPSLDISSFCHIGILSHLCLSLPRGLPCSRGYLGDRLLPTVGVFFQTKAALLLALVLGPGRASRLPGILAKPVAQ